MLARVRVKICGITSVADAKLAADAGADAIGLVFFAASKRNVTLEQARKIVQSLPAFVSSTALFVNPSIELVQEVISKTKVDLLQFHGEETVKFCEQFSRPYIKAVKIKNSLDFLEIASQYGSAQAVLFDTFVQGIAGGTGESFDWQLLNKQAQPPPPL